MSADAASMPLFRVFPWDGRSLDDRPGGPFYVPRTRQGSGRHDNPALYGALYCSLEVVSCVAESLQPFRNQTLGQSDLDRRGTLRPSLAAYELRKPRQLANLDDPLELQQRRLRPSRVATMDRRVTQSWAARIHESDRTGFLWWSTLESQWINCTLFSERSLSRLVLSHAPVPLSLETAEVQEAARHLGIALQ
jgi:hypothetical protein